MHLIKLHPRIYNLSLKKSALNADFDINKYTVYQVGDLVRHLYENDGFGIIEEIDELGFTIMWCETNRHSKQSWWEIKQVSD